MMAVITGLEYPRDLQGAEASSARWREHRAEVDSRTEAINNFLRMGNAMIEEKHFLSEEVSLSHMLYCIYITLAIMLERLVGLSI